MISVNRLLLTLSTVGLIRSCEVI